MNMEPDVSYVITNLYAKLELIRTMWILRPARFPCHNFWARPSIITYTTIIWTAGYIVSTLINTNLIYGCSMLKKKTLKTFWCFCLLPFQFKAHTLTTTGWICINILSCPLNLLMGIFCYCLGFLGDPVCEQLHSEFPEQETKKDKKAIKA